MANQDFDMVVVNQFERPTSADINTLESQLNRTIRDNLAAAFASGAGVPVNGFYGGAFTPTPGTPPTPGEVGVTLSAGLGYVYADAGSAVNPIPTTPPATGLSDLSRYKPLLLSSSRVLSLGAPPASGLCRRDVVCVTWNRDVAYQTIPIFSAGAGIFAGALRPKNVTFDLFADAVEIVPAGNSPTPGFTLLVLQGQTVPFVNEGSFLTAPLAALPSGFVPVAIVNVEGGVASIAANRIVDYRPLLLANASTTIGGSTNCQMGMIGVANAQITTPAGGRGTIVYVPNTASPQRQGVDIYLILGNTNLFEIGGESWNLSHETPPPSSTVQAFDRLLPINMTQGFISVTDQQKLAGTLAGYAVTTPLAVAVGQPYIKLSCVFGEERTVLGSAGGLYLSGDVQGNPSGGTVTFNNTTNAWLATGVAQATGNYILPDMTFSLDAGMGNAVTSVYLDSLAFPADIYRVAGSATVRRAY